jgi:hypothetical protein
MICFDKEDWEIYSSSAAAEKEPVFATLRKYCTCLSSTPPPIYSSME